MPEETCDLMLGWLDDGDKNTTPRHQIPCLMCQERGDCRKHRNERNLEYKQWAKTGRLEPMTEANKTVVIEYKNRKGRFSTCKITPIKIWFGSKKWHTEKQWRLDAYDAEKGRNRTFVMGDIVAWIAPDTPTEVVKVTVCSECLRASCWHGAIPCDRSKGAGTVDMDIKHLRKLNLESETYWETK